MKIPGIPIFLALALLPGCASSGAEADAAATTIQVRVDNNLVPATTVNVYAAQEGGTRTRLGSVMAGTRETFRFRPIVSSGTHMLVADPPGPGDELTSRPLILPLDGSAIIEWNLLNNDVNIEVVE